ncbi:hypothetical protein [Nostocoides japonicum]|nr:hypothetical protein [Tetrasphaera japonica]
MSRQLVVRASLVYLGLRLVSALLLWRASADQPFFAPWTSAHPGYLDMTVLWDGSWYRQIAEHGYPSVLPVDQNGFVAQNVWAFYPAYPLAVRLLIALTGGSFALVGSTLSLVLGWVAAVLMAGLLAKRIRPGLALAAMAVWAAFPASPILQVTYAESASMLALVLALWLLVERWWAAFGVLAVVVGLTRPIAAPLGLVLLVALVVRWRERRTVPVERSETVGMAVALAGTALGTVIWPAVAWLRTGRLDAYSQTEAAWRSDHRLRWGHGWVSITEWALRGLPHPKVLAPILLAALVVGLLLAVLGPWATRLGPELRAWCLAYPLYIVLVVDPFTAVFRFALPLFPLTAVFVGGARAGEPARSWRVRTVVLVGAGLVLQVAWIWKLLRFVPPSDYPP